ITRPVRWRPRRRAAPATTTRSRTRTTMTTSTRMTTTTWRRRPGRSTRGLAPDQGLDPCPGAAVAGEPGLQEIQHRRQRLDALEGRAGQHVPGAVHLARVAGGGDGELDGDGFRAEPAGEFRLTAVDRRLLLGRIPDRELPGAAAALRRRHGLRQG